MRSNRRPRPWPVAVPNADAALRASAARATATDHRVWGHLLARQRVARRQTLAEQAVALGTSESALTFLAVHRLPRAARRNEDLAAVAAIIGIAVEVLRDLLDDPK